MIRTALRSMTTSAARAGLNRTIMVEKLTPDFAAATKIVSQPIPELGPGQVLVKTSYLGINASDVNFTAGRYSPGSKPPFPAGFEAIGEVVDAGQTTRLAPGTPVALMGDGAFSEFLVVNEKTCFPLPRADPHFLPLLVSGLTASISLERVGEIKEGETVLVTAAAGGTGQFATQIAKQKGCKVIATCGSDDKVAFLKGLGADRVVNYKKEKLGDVLKKEYPSGVNAVYESVGGEMFEASVRGLAKHGRLVVIGFITGYQSQKGFSDDTRHSVPLPARLLTKSASVRGFFLFDYPRDFARHFASLVSALESGKMVSRIDLTAQTGLEAVSDAVAYLHSGKSVGKVIVPMSPQSKL